ncbi:MAG TPA: allantoate amidohydrolase [Usitatibacter sp.]|nr:allantoate amidohydrolase [Usitatibacter sp.]
MDAAVSPRDRAGRSVVERALALARHSDSPEHYTRTLFTPAHRAAARQLAEWMREAGMGVRVDAIGNVIGRYEAAEASGAKAVMLGSHFDSVRNGGKYDGVLGILVPVACIAQLHARGERLPHAVEVIAFSDEEGARFQTSFLSSRALAGRFDPAVLGRRDADGITLEAAMREVGLDPAAVDAARIDPAGVAAYVEVHIEQGPVLLREGLALGVVTTIAGGTRHTVRVRGEAGHAGTVPMAMRHDALAAAAEMVLAVEARCAAGGSLVGTVGILRVKEGTGNVIPGDVELSVDIRAAEDAVREAAERDVFDQLAAIATRRGVCLERTRTHHVQAVRCATWLQERLAESVRRVGVEPRRLASGAGHDAMIMAGVCDVGMLFVRCGAGGVSHNPAETVTAEDCGLAVEALLDFLRRFAAPA